MPNLNSSFDFVPTNADSTEISVMMLRDGDRENEEFAKRELLRIAKLSDNLGGVSPLTWITKYEPRYSNPPPRPQIVGATSYGYQWHDWRTLRWAETGFCPHQKRTWGHA